MIIEDEFIKEGLKEELGHEPTKGEFESFIDFLQSDVPEWLTDNLRSWMEELDWRDVTEYEE